MTKFLTTNIVGTASKNIWSQVKTILYDEHKLMLVVELSCDDLDSIIDMASVGVGIIEDIERRGQTAETSNQLKDLIKSIKSEIKQGLNIEILLASLRESTLVIYGEGAVETYLSRKGSLAKLGIDVVGELEVNDVIVFATTKFVEGIGLPQFREILTKEEFSAEFLVPLIHQKTETSSVAAIVGETKLEEKRIKWPIIKLHSDRAKKNNLWIGGVIFVLLIIMIGIGMVRRAGQIAFEDFTNLSARVDQKISETMSIGDINPERARRLLTDARNEIEAYLATEITETYQQKGKTLLSEIDKTDEKVFKKNDIQLTTVVELSILFDGLKSDKMKSDGKGNLVFLDKNNSRLVLMNLKDRSRQIVTPSGSDKYVDIAVADTKIYGLNVSGISEMSWRKSEAKKVIEADEFWKNPVYIGLFAGNVYIFDREQSEIWKYPTLGDTFGSRRRWLAAGITPDLTKVIDMKVAGDLYLITSTGKLVRYSRGAPVTFSMEGFPAKGEAKRFSAPSAMWVSESLVYVLENGAGRVVVVGLDGKFQAQYVNSEFEKASDLVVLDNKGYVLIDNVVKEFGL